MNQYTDKFKLAFISSLLLFTASSCGNGVASEPVDLLTIEPDLTPVIQVPTVTYSLLVDEKDKIVIENAEQLIEIDQVSVGGGSGFTWTDTGYGIAFSADEFIFNYSMDNMELVEGERIAADYPLYLTTDDDGRLLGWVDESNIVSLTDSGLSSDPLLIEDIVTPITGLVMSSGGDFIVIATQDQTIDIHDTETGIQLDSFITYEWLTDLSLSPDDRVLAGVHSPDFKIIFIDLDTGDVIKELVWADSITPGLTEVEFSPDWSVVAWVSGGEVQLMDVDSGELGDQLLHQDAVGNISWSPDGRMVATSSITADGDDFFPVINVWNKERGDVILSTRQESPILDLGFSPNQIFFGSLDAEGKFVVWAVDS